MVWNMSLYSVVRPQDALQVLNAVEDVDADATIEASRLEQPQVLALVLRWAHWEERAHALVEGMLRLLQLVAQLMRWHADVPLKYGEHLENLIELKLVVVVLEVDCQS